MPLPINWLDVHLVLSLAELQTSIGRSLGHGSFSIKRGHVCAEGNSDGDDDEMLLTLFPPSFCVVVAAAYVHTARYHNQPEQLCVFFHPPNTQDRPSSRDKTKYI